MKLYDGGILMIVAISMVVLGTGAVVGGAVTDSNAQSQVPEHRVVYVDYEEASYAETPECIEYEGRLYCD